MTSLPPTNATPKIIALAQGKPINSRPAEAIVLFIPDFRKDWTEKIRQFPQADLHRKSQQWIIPFSNDNIHLLENTFGKHILFAFKVGWLGGCHRTDDK